MGYFTYFWMGDELGLQPTDPNLLKANFLDSEQMDGNAISREL